VAEIVLGICVCVWTTPLLLSFVFSLVPATSHRFDHVTKCGVNEEATTLHKVHLLLPSLAIDPSLLPIMRAFSQDVMHGSLCVTAFDMKL
jgi:hypothetical protein